MSTKAINPETSEIKWVGKKIVGSHNGSIAIKEGFFTFENEELTGGEFLVDMSSINVEDLEGDYKKQLEDHLHSDDFFSTTNHTTAKLVFTNVSKSSNDKYAVTADLTIKGTTNPVKFDLEINNEGAYTELKVDRTKYGIRYGSGSFFDNLGDNTIRDNFTLKVSNKF
ncbi:YceI family protein [Zhouia sp. PK063]|uniref:YceI family protein n=1 Tax=Zhouia sp. PK063 TaxID=3373602 RepID=UPI00379A3E94